MRAAGASVTVGLAMIVKNEESILPRLARSLDGQLDHWTIVDTGSSDRTIEVAEEAFDGVPGRVIEDEWRGFGPSRNVALEAARDYSDWILMLDADDTFHGTIDRTVADDVDGLEARYYMDSLQFFLMRLLRAESDWEWRGRTHEYLEVADRPARIHQTTSFHVVHHADGANRPEKFERDLQLLGEDLRDNPDDPRTVFYLARTYEDMGDLTRAATCYRARTRLPGWEEETWYATWRLGRCLVESGRVDEGTGVLWRAWGTRPWRAEPLWTLAQYYRLSAQWPLCFEVCEIARRHCPLGRPLAGEALHEDRLFVHTDVYDWRIAYEQSLAAYYVGEKELGRSLTEELLGRPDLPPEFVASLQGNVRFYR